MKFKSFVLAFIACICSLFVSAQTMSIDSARKIVSSNAGDSIKLKALLFLTQQHNLNNFDENISFAKAGLQIAEKKKDSAAIGDFLHYVGIGYYLKGKFDSAASYYYKSLDILSSGKDLPKLASLYNSLGQLYRKIGPYSRSGEFYGRALSIYQSLKDKNGIATIYNEAGVLNEYEGKFEDAVKSYRASLAIRRELNDSEGIAYSLNFIAGVYTQMNRFAEAEEFNAQALTIRERMKDSFAIALTYTDFGSIYTAEKKYEKAIASYSNANRVAQALGYTDLLRNNYNELSNIAALQGDYKTSLDYFKLASSLKDSMYKNETSKQIEELSVKYETAEKEKQIQEQQFEITKRNYWIAAICALIVLGGLLSYSYYRRNKLKQEAKLQTELIKQQELATKAIIEAEEKERKRIAGDLHDGVGQMMSAAKMNLSAIESNLVFTSEEQKNNFVKVVRMIDESCQEVRTVSHNMMPNVLLKAGLAAAIREFVDKINKQLLDITLYTEGLDQRVDANTEIILYRVIQECVNNVIKHANASTLDISIIKDDDGISTTIEDNGKGFDTGNANAFEGIGLKNIRSRVEYLKGTVEWSSAAGKGTVVAIHVPL